VNDFIGAAVEDKSGTLLGWITRAALHGIHLVFPPSLVTGHISGTFPISVIEGGNAQWHHKKEILGYLVNGETKTIRILEATADDTVMQLRRILKTKNIQLKQYQNIVGKLHHVALILPGIRGLFLPINKALQGKPKVIGIGKHSDIRMLPSWTWPIWWQTALATRPTYVKELVPIDDHYIGYCDACTAGASGIWLSRDLNIRPIIWKIQFSANITNQGGHLRL
jgi:hypothetical protein